MSDYQPPRTVAVITTESGAQYRAFRTSKSGWRAAGPGDFFYDREVTNVRPLVVLDPEGAGMCLEVFKKDIASLCTDSTAWPKMLRDVEAQTSPPKPPEPTGLGAVVEDRAGDRWIRVEWGNPWCRANPVRRAGGDSLTHGTHVPWERLDAVRVLSEGVL
jgi:hypothetical protein